MKKAPPLFEKGGASHQPPRPVHLPWPRSHTAVWAFLGVQTEPGSWGGSWVTWPWGPYTSDMTQGHFPHPSGWPSACLPSLADVPAKGPFLAPGLFFLPGGSSGERAGAATQGAGEKWKQGPQGRLPAPTPLLCQGCQGSETGAQPPCSVEMKRTLSWSCSW